MSAALCFRSQGPDATYAAARALGALLAQEAGSAPLQLSGPLGAGKTWFVKGLAEGLGIDPDQVASPTFTIVHQYAAAGAGPGRASPGKGLAHVDCYRLECEAELFAAGFLDLLEDGAVVAVEWGDRFPEALPADRLEVDIERRGEGADLRRLRACAGGPVSASVLARWRARLTASGALAEFVEL